MTDTCDIEEWPEKIRQRYENYLKTSFFFADSHLRASFESALRDSDNLLKGPFKEPDRDFKAGVHAHKLIKECFSDNGDALLPAVIDKNLYTHQETAIRTVFLDGQNTVVATGTASGKTESFLYPLLFELYRQHLSGDLKEPGVRALILYPMNALANDQRERLGKICQKLKDGKSDFQPTFGQYIGQTPDNAKDHKRNAEEYSKTRQPGEFVFREEMRQTPPHILLTNYSMLEYLLMRPDDSPLFDSGGGKYWQFLILDEAHQYRGTKGMEMGMLLRRLKQRLRDGGREGSFRCIATSATISAGEGEQDRIMVAEFAKQLFGEPFSSSEIVFGNSESKSHSDSPRRYHAFIRALEGAFLVNENGQDKVLLNRKSKGDEKSLEIALCRECGQHYYVGKERDGKLQEANRDPSHHAFGVDYYLPVDSSNKYLCRRCGLLSESGSTCDCMVSISVKKCDSDATNPDQLKECENCGYRRGGIGDPVQEIVHGSDGPNSVIATALHELLPEENRKVLAFSDSRQEAAFFAWYAENSYEKLRDRNLLLKSVMSDLPEDEGLSIEDLKVRLLKQYDKARLFKSSDSAEQKQRYVMESILREAITDEKRLSLAGVGLLRWMVLLPDELIIPDSMQQDPWNLTERQSKDLVAFLLDDMRSRRAVKLPEGAKTPHWDSVSPWPQQAFALAPPSRRKNIRQWGSPQSAIIKHFLARLLKDRELSESDKTTKSIELMKKIWQVIMKIENDPLLVRAKDNGTFQLNLEWVRIKPASNRDIWECNICSSLSNHNILGICPRNLCPGNLSTVDEAKIENNHYRILYQSDGLPPKLKADEHTAQIDSKEARKRQNDFKNGDIHLLSSSTTFEVGVDLGDLESVFLRNVPPEPFNYTQRAGRAGRRKNPGLVMTYCRRNSHDLYHYEDPESRIISGTIQPPRLKMTNETIVMRHMVAVVLSGYFRDCSHRFKNVNSFVGDWANPTVSKEIMRFCTNNVELKDAICRIVPQDLHNSLGLISDDWIIFIVGQESRLAEAEREVCNDYKEMERLRKEYFDKGMDKKISQARKRMKDIAEEPTLNFLSRKAVIPKYGFPVDVVELEILSSSGGQNGVQLQRDLSQAIAEYAPGCKIVANKKEWESYGIKRVPGKGCPEKFYHYDGARNFEKWNERPDGKSKMRKYLIPKFGFVTQMFENPPEPHGRARRLYTTRPFFPGFDSQPEVVTHHGIEVTKAVPGELVILCEGKNREGFYICQTCGRHLPTFESKHKSPTGSDCRGTLEHFSFGHELKTSVVRLQFPRLHNESDAYSLAYSVLLGAAEILDVPNNDLNVTITGIKDSNDTAIVLYDNVPGGAGLVEQLESKDVFTKMLIAARSRVSGGCGCDSSCYGCLRSYRNQFVHTQLDRCRAFEVLDNLL